MTDRFDHAGIREPVSARTAFLYGLPLTIFPFAIYLFFGLTGWVTDWLRPILSIPLPSGGVLDLGLGDLLVMFALLALFMEVLKSTQAGAGSWLDLVASTVIFVLALACFVLLPSTATPTFLILVAIALFDVIASFSAARRRRLQRVLNALS